MSRAARLNRRITQLAVGRHLPHRTVRVRLTLLYGGLFLLSGAALMAIAYVLLVNAGFVFTLDKGTSSESLAARPDLAHGGRSPSFPVPSSPTHPSTRTMAHWRTVAQCMRDNGVPRFPDPATSVPPKPAGSYGMIADRDGAILAIPATIDTQSPAFTQATTACGFMPDYTDLSAQDIHRRTQVRQQLLIQSGIALAGMSMLSLGLGWLVAGRVLQPLEDSYEAQRQFVANASHELRAPLTRQRALIEVALANPQADVSSLRSSYQRVLASEQQLEQLIDGLLSLTRGQAGLERRERVDLAVIVSEALLARESELAGLDIDIHGRRARAATAGDPRLLERLVANLIDNAIHHNVPGGRVEISTGTRERRALLTITNTGPTIPPEQIERLFQPFQRLGDARTRRDTGHGLGLSIVQAIADAHGAELAVHARPGGGLTVGVSFAPAGGASPSVPVPLSGRQARARAPVSDPDAPARG